MKLRYLYGLITAIAFMLIAGPMAMACGSGQLSPGADVVYQVDAFKAVSVTALDIGAGSSGAIQNRRIFNSEIAYKSPKEHEIHRKPMNDGKVAYNVLVTAYHGRNLYSGVTAA